MRSLPPFHDTASYVFQRLEPVKEQLAMVQLPPVLDAACKAWYVHRTATALAPHLLELYRRQIEEAVAMQIFVSNLAWATTEEELRQLFEPYGFVESVRIITDRETGRARGFGFVEMPHIAEAQAAIDGLHGTSLGGRPLTVNEARQREERGGPGRRRW